ncbi:hypothetical protein STENM327S_02698 [Streptomyces tendae]
MGHGVGLHHAGLPNSSRRQALITVALNGFHSAMCRSQGVIWLESTKAFETNVTRNSQMIPHRGRRLRGAHGQTDQRARSR